MTDCRWNEDGPPWYCLECEQPYSGMSENPPRRNCPHSKSARRKLGIGDILHDVLRERLGVGFTLDCDCREWIALMNVWEPKGCRENLDKIVANLLGQAKKRKWKLDGRPILSKAAEIGTKLPGGMAFARAWARSLVSEAIEKCEEDMARRSKVTWAYGVTTTPERKDDLLPRTLASLAQAGFDKPRLFVDGDKDAKDYEHFGLDVTLRDPTIRTFGNWALTLWELYLREPTCQRYAIFQDDLVTYPNLRQYLDSCVYPTKGYWNLYTFPVNQKLAPADDAPGWYLSNQLGKGAVALVFSLPGVTTLLASNHFVGRPQSAQRGWRAVDGGIVSAFKKAGWQEYVHNPSLVQHTGLVSSMHNSQHPTAPSFRGEEFDAMELVPK